MTRSVDSNPERSDSAFVEWMRGNLTRAARHFGVTIGGRPVFGWHLRSIGAQACDGEGVQWWLRVGSERAQSIRDAGGDFWTGIVDANVLPATVPRPWVSQSMQWVVPEFERRVRADLMTWMPGEPCSPTEELTEAPKLPHGWWGALRQALNETSLVSTARFADRVVPDSRPAREVFNLEVPLRHWSTGHRDLHWNNLLAPELTILDWEMWGRAPVGIDAASLYCTSLLVPEVAHRMLVEFEHMLNGPAGRAVLIHAAAGVILHTSNADLADRLRAFVIDVTR